MAIIHVIAGRSRGRQCQQRQHSLNLIKTKISKTQNRAVPYRTWQPEPWEPEQQLLGAGIRAPAGGSAAAPVAAVPS